MKKLTHKKLDQILSAHKLWLESEGSEGKRADLKGADMRFANLKGIDLRFANLKGAKLQMAYLQGVEFDVNISRCFSFAGARFTSDALPWLILHPNWADWKHTVRIKEA